MTGWKITPLGELCDVLDSKRKPVTKKDRISGKFPYYGATGILDYVDQYIFDEKLVLVGEDGAKWGAGANSAFSVEGKCWVNNHAHVLRPKRRYAIDEWIIYYLNATDLSAFITGLTVPKLNQAKMREIPIPLPPLSEQRRIVAILDRAIAGLDTMRANSEKNIYHAEDLFARYLNAIFERKGNGWVERTLGQLADFKNGLNFTKSSKGETIKIVGVKDFQDFLWIPREGLDDVRIGGVLSPEYELRKHDILTVRSNGNKQLIGRCILAGDVNAKISHSGFTIRIRITAPGVDPIFLVRLLKSEKIRKMLIESGDGANISSLNQKALADLPIAYPAKIQQLEIAARVQALEEETTRLGSLYTRKLAAIAELKQSLLQKAFSGQLTSSESLAA